MSSIIFLYIIGVMLSLQVEGYLPETFERVMQDNSKSELIDLYYYTSNLSRNFNKKLLEMKINNNIYMFGIIYLGQEYFEKIVNVAEHTNHSVEICRQSEKILLDAAMAVVAEMNKCMTDQFAMLYSPQNNIWNFFNGKITAFLGINDVTESFCDTKMGKNMIECNDIKNNTNLVQSAKYQKFKHNLKTSINAAISNASDCIRATQKNFDNIVGETKLNAVKCIVDSEE